MTDYEIEREHHFAIGACATEASANQEWVQNACDPEPARCPCHGSGWMNGPRDTEERCPIHYRGQMSHEQACAEADMAEHYAAIASGYDPIDRTDLLSGLEIPPHPADEAKEEALQAEMREWVDNLRKAQS